MAASGVGGKGRSGGRSSVKPQRALGSLDSAPF